MKKIFKIFVVFGENGDENGVLGYTDSEADAKKYCDKHGIEHFYDEFNATRVDGKVHICTPFYIEKLDI